MDVTEGTVNPWLSRPTPNAVTEPAGDLVTDPGPDARLALLRPTGPSAPQPGVPAPEHVDRLPTRTRLQPAGLWCLGAHGGAGETTLAALSPGWAAADHAWPQVPTAAGPAPVVLVARSSAHGLLAAQRATTQWAAGLAPDVDLLGLVVVADAPGRLPRPLRELAHVVGGGVARTWHLPWVEPWRLGEPVDPATAPRPVRRLLDDLTALLHHPPAQPAVPSSVPSSRTAV